MEYFGILVIIFAIILGVAIFYSKQFNQNSRFNLAMISLIIAGLALITLISSIKMINNIASLLIIILSAFLVIRFFYLLSGNNRVTESNVKNIKHLLKSQQAKDILSSMKETIVINRVMTIRILVREKKLKISNHQNELIKRILDEADEKDIANAKHITKVTIDHLDQDNIIKLQNYLDKRQNS